MAPKTATRKQSAAGSASRPRTAARSTTKARATPARAEAAPKTPKLGTRAVMRLIEAGSGVECTECGEQVKFKARERFEQAICNVYVKGVWDRVEHYHAECYAIAGEPYGPAEAAKPKVAGSRPTNKVNAPPAA
jgi:hypothetical protein